MSVIGRRDQTAKDSSAREDLRADPAVGLLASPGGACIRPRGMLDEAAVRRLEREAVALVDDGIKQIVIDLRAVDSLTPSIPSMLWAVHRLARAKGSRLTVVVGDTPTARAMDRAGLLAGLTTPPASEQPFFEWTR